ncbi:NAD-dependent epimerase/dehydratase family protein [Streptomyces sp. NBC_00841]|uniref:NAD-dependent epimerase/dehydratase family protein n=1 Tax=unclassified Streptomyces TaxID=2593676 RepID=UPI0022533961|nr:MULTISPECIES: NAD-dependent epimerase/dehydratase family protein [unclassified Streptomyces]MCX4535032.1 NAD-dependent epimerase/dehydratase family protein [Streptomyces sp. NBC_01669]WRZ99652.1 NAD-dependent epimerase/dehydratase family protein [Streptomyces sp. NBC_00841]
MTTHILVTGASGFVGRHVVAAADAVPGLRLRLMEHRASVDVPASAAGSGIETVHGDLAAVASLRGICDGVDTVIHCASQINGDERTVRSVNDLGTRALVEEAERAGVARIVYLSTAAVYGRGPFTDLAPGRAPLAPGSLTSVTRAAAERHVLAAGGTVLRPHLVYGEGDRWVIPGLVALVRELSSGLAGCAARHSMIDVRVLGRALLAAALSLRETAGIHHVNHPDPVACSELVAAVSAELGLEWGAADIALDEARAQLAESPRLLHSLQLLTVDHRFTDDWVWELLDCDPGDGFKADFPLHADWYRNFLTPPGQG